MDKKKQGSSNREWGRQAEQLAADYLIANGYVIRHQNWRVSNHIEIDIIAEIDGIIVFVEVKARKGDYQSAEESIDANKRRKMVRGGDAYLRTLEHMYPFRMDIITVTGTPDNYEIVHLPDAFLPELS